MTWAGKTWREREQAVPDPRDYCIFSKWGAAYLANSPRIEPAALHAWRPQRSLYTYARRAIGLLPGLRIRETYAGGHTIRYWDLWPEREHAIVLLHGFTASKENWLNILYLLGRSRRVLVPDVPGFGESSFDPGADYRIEAQAQRMLEWSGSLGLSSAHWAGSSMGGAIAGAAAALEPRAIRSLALIDSAGVTGAEMRPFERDFLEGKNGLVAHSRRDVCRIMQLVAGERWSLQGALLARLIAADQVPRAAVYQHLFREMITPGNFPSPYWACAVEAPTLILWGSEDKILHPCEAGVLHRLIPGSELEMLDGIGHLPMLEAPFKTARLLREFWRRAEGAA